MLTKEECLKAWEVIEKDCIVYECYWDTIGSYLHGEELMILKQLIAEHFDNTPDFKGFKLYSDSVLKSFTKDELIYYIHMVYKNWESTDWYLNNSIKRNKELSEEIEELDGFMRGKEDERTK